MREQTIARIENSFIFNAQYQLSSREQKILLFLISNINPLESNFEVQVIPIKEMKEVLLAKRSGSFYSEMEDFALRISQKQIIFDTKIVVEGNKKMKGVINWFQSIIPVYDDKGNLCFKFRFAEDLKPFLIELKEYTQINYLETIPLKSVYSIRLYQVFKAYRDKMRKHQKRSTLVYDLQDLKKVLGVQEKYKDWRKFNERVLRVVESEINEHTSIRVKVGTKRKGRKVTGINFELWDKGSGAKRSGKVKSVDGLTFAQFKAYNMLCAYGVEDGISLEMVSRVGGSETEGFEDWYFESVLGIFEQKAKEQNAGVLVNWFLKKKVFDQGDMFAKIMEQLVERKKRLRESDIKAWDNRQLAKGMSAEAFRNKFKK